MFKRLGSRTSETVLISLLLTVIIFAVYGQVATHHFIYYDDPLYVQENPTVLSGLTPANIRWAFSTLSMANWHPFTWLSYMLDIQLFGPNPGAMLLENTAIHALNAILLFILLDQITGARWRSAAVAFFFAIHPLHVESVAWISERKDVLSTLFWLVSMLFYARYAAYRNLRPYLASLAVFSCGLMVKPMLVTLPLVLLMLDFWPLGRFGTCRKDNEHPSGSRNLPAAGLLVLEKLPFLIIAACSSVMTVKAQSGAMTPLVVTSLADRVLHSLNAYLVYLGKTVWPLHLSPFYPYPENVSALRTLAGVAALTGITWLSLRNKNRYPYLVAGWFWYLITLVPVIGIVKIGLHAFADRYTYIPLIGIFVMLAWGAADFAEARPAYRKYLAAVTVLFLSACAILTWRQVSFWKDTHTLFSHARDITVNNYVASNILAIDSMKKGRNEEALKLFDQSIDQASWFIEPYAHKANLLKKMNRNEEAIDMFNRAMLLNPLNSTVYNDLANLHATQGRLEEAVEYLMLGLRVDPRSGSLHYNLGMAYHQLGLFEEAITHYKLSLKFSPAFPDTYNNLGISLAELGEYNEAALNFNHALQLKPDYIEARINLETATHLSLAKSKTEKP